MQWRANAETLADAANESGWAVEWHGGAVWVRKTDDNGDMGRFYESGPDFRFSN
jgi:hypothetical protein